MRDSMAGAPRYRPVRLARLEVEVRRSRDATYVRSSTPLAPYAARTTDLLLHWAARAPQRTFLARKEQGSWRCLSYADTLAWVRAIAQALLERELHGGRPVLILSGNDLEHALLALACQYAGVPYAPLSPACSLQSADLARVRHAAALLRPGLVFASDGALYGPALQAAIAADVEIVLTRGQLPGRVATPFASLLAARPQAAVEQARLATGPDTVVKFLFTSGSTRLPKAVITTQRMLCANQQMLVQCWPFLADEAPVLLDWLPWHHTFGGSKNFNLALFNGGTLYIDDGRPTRGDIGVTLANLKEVAPTVYFNVPKGWEEVARALGADAALRERYYSRLRLQFYAGAGLAQPVWDQLHASAEQACGARIVMATGLGMTETAPSALFQLGSEARAGEVGVPCPGTEVKLVREGGKLEIRYRGPNVTPGYWRAPQECATLFDDEGYLRSGDAVRWRDPARPALGFRFDGRLAEDFKLSTGTWVSVAALRERAVRAGAPCLQDVVVTGHDRAEIGLLIVPRLESCRELAGLHEDAAPAAVLEAPAVRRFFVRLVQLLHDQGSGSASRVMRACLLAGAPSIDRGEITDKGSISQRAMLLHRAAIVEALYEGRAPHQIDPVISEQGVPTAV